MKTAIWISFDLGLNGDYQSLYTWLDNHKAKECGYSFAFIKGYQYNENIVEELKQDLENNVSFKKNDRIYAVTINNVGKIEGSFIKGNRKNDAPWSGYSTIQNNVIDEI